RADRAGAERGGMINPVRWENGRLVLLDQTRLPAEEVERSCASWTEVADAIRRLVVRGAPAIGVAAAFGLVLAARESVTRDASALRSDLEDAIKGLAATRPTAVNLFWALDRMRRVIDAGPDLPAATLAERLLAEAQAISAEDLAANHAMGAHGVALVPEGARVLTHCNAGALATAGYGTAVGVIRAAHERGRLAMVWVDETRPGMQGSAARTGAPASRWCGSTRRGRSCRARGSPPGSWPARASRTGSSPTWRRGS